MNNKALILTLIIVVVLLSSCVYENQPDQKSDFLKTFAEEKRTSVSEIYVKSEYKDFYKSNPDACSNLKKSTSSADTVVFHSNLCYTAISKETYSNCDFISNSYEKDLCYLAYVSKTGNWLLCEYLDNSDVQKECYKNIKIETLPSLHNINLDSCVENIKSWTHKDETLLKNFEICMIAIESHNPDACQNIKNPYDKDMCFLIFSKLSKNKSICENIKHNYLQNECKK